MSEKKKGVVRFLQEFSVPLIVGVFAALLAANLAPSWYHRFFGEIHGSHADSIWNLHFSIFGHVVGLHFLVNDVFMVFFFGIAAKEITEACLPGGSLNPIKNAVNPLVSTMGGVVGPVAVFFGVLFLWHGMSPSSFPEGTPMFGEASLSKGWGIPTATDIALAWLVARAVFGKGHPAINFLLLLAVADDAIGLGIIAVFYGDPANPANPAWLGLVGLGMVLALGMRKMGVKSWLPYIFVAGPISWSGLMMAHLHPALALVPIVPFLPAAKTDPGLFVEDEADHSTLHMFEHQMKLFVDLGLFFFAFANAGVQLAGIGPMTWIILLSLVIGKTVGITGFGLLAQKLGFKLPAGMDNRELVMAGFVAALGLTVALFVAGAAFIDPVLQGQAKMGALFSGFVGVAAILLARIFGFGSTKKEARPELEERVESTQTRASTEADRSISTDLDSVAAAMPADTREAQAAPTNEEQDSH